MAAWKIDPGDDAEGGQQPQAGEADDGQPLFGKFRRTSGADADSDAKSRSMSEMWGFEGEVERREARRRKFWALPESNPAEDNEPWKQFRTAPKDVVSEDLPPLVPLWTTPHAAQPVVLSEDEDEGEYEPGPEPEDDEARTPELEPGAGRSGGDQRNGWRSFLADVPPAFAHPAPILPDIPATPPEPATHFSFVKAPALAASYPLVMETQVDMSSAVAVCTHLGRDWEMGFEPTVADIVIRAFARAIGREPSLRELSPSVAILDLGAEQDMGCLLDDAGRRSFKNAVGTLAELSPELLEGVAVSFTDYGMLGIARATPRLQTGQWLALAFGARTWGPMPAGDAVTWKPIANLCLAYDGERVNDGAAARVLARIRTLVEMPDELLAD